MDILLQQKGWIIEAKITYTHSAMHIPSRGDNKLNNVDGKFRQSNLFVYFYHTLAISSTNKDHVKGFIDNFANGTMETVCDIEEPYNITSFVTLVKNGKMFGTL